jgi:hypothetical protein
MSKLTKGYKTGRAQKVGNCCREIRIQSPSVIGEIYEGLNTLTDKNEKWMLIKIANKSINSIVQQIF